MHAFSTAVRAAAEETGLTLLASPFTLP